MRCSRPLIVPILLLPLFVASARDASAMGGIEGSFEYAIDAPWRMEPVVDGQGHATYGAIPIQLTVLDENVIPLDSFGLKNQFNGTTMTPTVVATNRMIGNFCDLVVSQGNIRRHIGLNDLAEIETTGNASTTWQNGAWQRGQAPPPHARCQPGKQSCTGLANVHGTSEWHASAWYTPTGAMTPGADLALTATASFTRSPQIACAGAKSLDLITLTNSLSVHLGEAPLPRFNNDSRWAYGDLHFHGQGTDNEGEAGYSYRGVVRAMGAMGMDFVLATEHASDSVQILDIDYNGPIGAVFAGHLVSRNGSVLRDMDAERFAFLHGQLWAADGVNKMTALDGRTTNNTVAYPQTVLGHRAAPQIFIGGEVDAMPELPANFPANGSFVFGNGVTYDLKHLCDGWNGPVTSCSQNDTVQQDQGVTILKDVQGYDAMYPARVHLVYMPKDPNNAQGFVASKTGVFGGGGRHLTVGNGVLTEMEGSGGVQKGYAFLAHPVPGGTCEGGTPEMKGNEGPDVIPYTKSMLDQAFRSKAVLGLELWNEDTRMKNEAGVASTKETGYESSFGMGGHGMRNDEPKGFQTGAFSLYPWARPNEPSYQKKCTSMEWTLHHGLKEWDDMLMRGITPSQTASLAWVAPGEPRRVYMAGGSDAHGDLNYHRAGYTLGLSQIDDMGLGKPRNLVFAGAPDVTLVSAPLQNKLARALPGTKVEIPNNDVKTHSQSQILNAMVNGAFGVTDGPALRVAIDRNGNGTIDDGDIPMGGVVELYGEKSLPLLVEWDSTAEWGPVGQIDIVIGAVSSTEPAFQVMFAPTANGPRSAGTPSTAVARTRTVFGHTLSELADGYTQDPTGVLRFTPFSLSGHKRIDLPLNAFAIGENHGQVVVPDRLYVRAFARSTPTGTNGQCTPDPKVGQCILRYGFSNPVWAITPPRPAGTCPKDKPRSIDSDSDGLPDGCDACPYTSRPVCPPTFVPPGGGPLQTK